MLAQASEVVMNVTRALTAILLFASALLVLASATEASAQQPTTKPDAQEGKSLSIGTVEAINDKTFTVKLDSGDVLQATLPDSARIVRIAPGQKDVTHAVPIQRADIQVGDRILMAGNIDDKVLTA